MKSFLLILSIISVVSVSAQSVSNGVDLDEQNFDFMLDDGRFVDRKIIGAGKGKEIEWKVKDPITGEANTYTTPFEMDGNELERRVGYHVAGEYMYEFYMYPGEEKKTPGLTDPMVLSMVKRNVNNGFKAEGGLMPITNSDYHREQRHIYCNDEYFYIIIRHNPTADLSQLGVNKPGVKNLPVNNYIVRSNFDLDDQYTMKLDFLQNQSIELRIGNVDGMNNLIQRVAVKEDNAVNHALLIFGDGDSPAVLAPQIDEGFTFNKYELYFDNKKNELVGVYSILERPEKNQGKLGYKYFRWNLEGDIVTSEKHWFTYEDIFTKEVKDYLSRQGAIIEVKDNDNLPSLDMYTGFPPELIPLPDGGCLISFQAYNEESSKYTKFFSKNLSGIGFNFAVGPDGKLQWTKAYKKEINGLTTPTDYYSFEGQIVASAVSQDCYFNSDEFKFVEKCETRPSDQTNINVIELVDRNTGETNRIIPYKDTERWSYLKRNIYFLESEGMVMVEFRNTRRNSMFYTLINLN